MLKVVSDNEDGEPVIELVLVERNLRRLEAGQPIEVALVLELRTRNGGRRKTVVHVTLGYAATHTEALAGLLATGEVFTREALAKLQAWAEKADTEGLEVQDHTVGAFDS